mmetsp:Transcript_321/g.577  ORF Transcript_321/g.577 Transcript_321/m.577 type:complete len:282 (-) Transcript_321:15-860(-)
MTKKHSELHLSLRAGGLVKLGDRQRAILHLDLRSAEDLESIVVAPWLRKFLPGESTTVLTRRRPWNSPCYNRATGSDEAEAEPCSSQVPRVPGAFVLQSVLSIAECGTLVRFSYERGYSPCETSGVLRSLWLINHDENFARELWQRVCPLLPKMVDAAPIGFNPRFRFYRYPCGNSFALHQDVSVQCPAVPTINSRPNQLLESRLTLLLYLDEAFCGGETSFWRPIAPGARVGESTSVRAGAGSALCFWHGDHPMSPLHEGSVVREGVKHVLRTDVLYENI